MTEHPIPNRDEPRRSADGEIRQPSAIADTADAPAMSPPLRHDAETTDCLRLWLRLLATTNTIERELARRLRQRFQCSLARFDLLAQLDKAEGSLTMGELSARLMVSNGNVTGLVRRLVSEGLVQQEPDPHDRRMLRVRLTPSGRRLFSAMARAHAGWVRALLERMSREERDRLAVLLARLRGAVGTTAPAAGESSHDSR